MKGKRNHRFSNDSDALSTVPMRRVPLIEILGRRRVLVENHKGVSSFSTDEICIQVHKGCVRILGADLEIRCMSKERIIILGTIADVNLREDGT